LESGKTAKPAYLAALKESSAGLRGWRPAGLASAGARMRVGALGGGMEARDAAGEFRGRERICY
jgi:hypothetical protein